MSTETQTQPVAETFLQRKEADAHVALSKLEAQITDLEARVEEALGTDDFQQPTTRPHKPEQVTVWGVPFSKLTLAETFRYIDQLIAWGEPGYFITANLNYNMLTDRHPELQQINDDASFIVCDGMPMVWWSKWLRDPLPERVAGSELIYALTKWAAEKSHRVYFLGAAPGVAQKAADTLSTRYPGLQVAGVESPPFRPLTDDEESELIARVKATKPDILYLAFGQPKGEKWIAEHCRELGVPVCVQIGASFDFVAGGVHRAPMWMQKIGMEWMYRLLQEPKRLFGRYWSNGLFLLKAVARETLRRKP